MTNKEPAALTAGEQASYQQMADIAEGNSAPMAPRGRALHGSDAAAQARDMLAAAGMDPAQLNRLIGGRPSVDPEATPGRSSPQLNLRVSADLKRELKVLADARNVKPSELARSILAEGVRELRVPNRTGLRVAKMKAIKREKHPA